MGVTPLSDRPAVAGSSREPEQSDIDEELTKLAIRQALEQHGYYFETIEATDCARADQLGRLGRAVADELGVEVGMAAKLRRRDAGVQICITVARTPLTPEPA